MKVSLGRLLELADQERHVVHEKDCVQIRELSDKGKGHLINLRNNLVAELVHLKLQRKARK